MRHLFLLNPRAGKYDRTREVREKAGAALAGRDEPWEAAVTEYPGHAAELARAAAETGERVRIYACGGDGTLNECAVGAAGFANAAVTHYPMGSGNDFLRMFGPDACRFYDFKELLDAPQAPLDLIDCNGRLALNVCSVGFDARIGLGAKDFKNLPLVSGTMAYQLSAVRTILQGIHQPYRVSIDGEALPGEEFTLLCACNGRYYGGGFNPSRTAMPDDGLLDFVVIPAVSRLTVLALIGKYAKGGAGDIEGVTVRRGREMRVACGRVSRINLDGEELLDSELSITVSAKKVNFFYPAGTHWDPARRSTNGKSEKISEKMSVEEKIEDKRE